MGLLSLILVLLPFFASMLITNDVALITFCPLYSFGAVNDPAAAVSDDLIVLQTIAANLGSMAAPVGKSQSLFLYEKFHLSAGGYFRLMLPFVLAGLVCLAAAALLVKNETIQVEFSARETIKASEKAVPVLRAVRPVAAGRVPSAALPLGAGRRSHSSSLWDRPLSRTDRLRFAADLLYAFCVRRE